MSFISALKLSLKLLKLDFVMFFSIYRITAIKWSST